LKIFYSENLFSDLLIGLASGLAVIYLLKIFTKGKTVDDICTIAEGKITVEGSELYVDGMFVTNLLGTPKSREIFLKEGAAFVISPKKENYRVTLDNQGQQQAILFEAVRSFGVKRYQFSRKNHESGQTIIAFVPIIRDIEGVINAIKKTPILENSRKIASLKRAKKEDGEK